MSHSFRHVRSDVQNRLVVQIVLDPLEDHRKCGNPVRIQVFLPSFPKGIENLFGCFGICFPPSAPVGPIVHQARLADLFFRQALRRVTRTGLFASGILLPPPPPEFFHHFRFIAACEQGDKLSDPALRPTAEAMEGILIAPGLVGRRKIQVVLAIRCEPIHLAERAIYPVIAIVGLAAVELEAMFAGHLDDVRKHAWQRASPS